MSAIANSKTLAALTGAGFVSATTYAITRDQLSEGDSAHLLKLDPQVLVQAPEDYTLTKEELETTTKKNALLENQKQELENQKQELEEYVKQIEKSLTEKTKEAEQQGAAALETAQEVKKLRAENTQFQRDKDLMRTELENYRNSDPMIDSKAIAGESKTVRNKPALGVGKTYEHKLPNGKTVPRLRQDGIFEGDPDWEFVKARIDLQNKK